jgi:hypothetical protein
MNRSSKKQQVDDQPDETTRASFYRIVISFELEVT